MRLVSGEGSVVEMLGGKAEDSRGTAEGPAMGPVEKLVGWVARLARMVGTALVWWSDGRARDARKRFEIRVSVKAEDNIVGWC